MNHSQNNIIEIKNDITELNNMIDKKCLEIYNQNDKNNNTILKYKIYMENIILEHHKICKLIFSNQNK
jgi:hypothetical protein